MLINKLIQYIFGYVLFSFYGAYPEKFITQLQQNGINIWDTYCKNGIYYSTVSKGNYKKLKPIAKRCGIRLKAVMQAGMPLLFQRYKKRIGMVIGMAIFAIILAVNSQYIWTVKVIGCETLSEETVLQAMEELGVYSGVKRSSIDYRMVSEKARLMLPDVSWIYVNIKGCLAQIELSERTYAPEIEYDYCNIIAAQEGQIVSVEGYAGETKVKPGDGVAKGDLLISGVVTDQYGKTTFSRASGKVIANTEKNYAIDVSLTQSEYRLTGESRDYHYINFFGTTTPLFFGELPEYDYTEQVNEDILEIYGEKTPVSLTTRTVDRIEEVQFEITPEQALKMAHEQWEQIKQNELSDCEIINENIEEITLEDSVSLKVRVNCKENIAIQQNFIVN